MKASLAAASLFSIFVLPLAAPHASAQQNAGAFQCIATSVEAGHATIYVNQIMPGDASQRAALTSAWSAYVHAAYPQQTISSAVCNPTSADPTNQQRMIAMETNAWQKGGLQVVQVNWNPAQQGRRAPNSHTNPYADAEPAKDSKGDAPADKPKDDSADTAPSGPPPRASYCYSDDKKPTIYFSDPFDTQGLPSPAAWQKAFSAMLAQKYSYKGIVTCKDKATIVDVQSIILEQKDALQGKDLIDTNWSYEPPAAPQQ